MFNFPSNPAPGDAFQPAPNASYMWNDVFWERGVGVLLPFITVLVPNQGPTNDPGIVVSVQGGNFRIDSKVHRDGAELATTFISGSELQVTLPGEIYAKVVQITVVHLGMTSNALPFTYIQPAPYITELLPNFSPTNVVTAVAVKGGNFTAQSKVIFDGVELATTFTSATELRITAPVKTAADTCNVTVIDGALTSNTVVFNYMLKTMWLHEIRPNNVMHTDGQTGVHFLGEGFVRNMRIIMGNVDVSPVNYTDSTEVWTLIFPNTWNMGSPATPSTIYCYLWNPTTGESTNSLPFTFK